MRSPATHPTAPGVETFERPAVLATDGTREPREDHSYYMTTDGTQPNWEATSPQEPIDQDPGDPKSARRESRPSAASSPGPLGYQGA